MSAIGTLIAAGFTLGLSVAAPVGPVGTAAIREGLERGTRQAFMLGLGAATVDFIYLGLVYMGMAPILLRIPGLVPATYALGGALLGHMALEAFRKAWRPPVSAGLPTVPGGGGRSVDRNSFLYGLGMTVFNPATILLWIGLGGAFVSAHLVGRPVWVAFIGVFSAFAGSAIWFGFLAVLSGGLRILAAERPWIFRIVNLTAGLVLGLFSVYFLMRAVGRG